MPLYHATFLNQLVKQCSKLHKLMINVKGDLSVHEKPLSILLDGLNCIDSLIINYETPFVSGEKVNDIIFSTAFDNVRFLALSGEGWTQFPKQISNKKKIALKELIIYNTLLINLDGISNLDSLEGLSILSSRSDQVFDFFEAYRCTSLKTVTISSTTIDSIGSGILNLINLQEIELVNNFQLSYLDRRIFCLSNLKKFSLETHYLRLRSWEPGLKRLVKRLYKDVIKKKEPCLSDWNMHPWFSLVSIIITK
jgi:hypothetical protein